MTLANLEQLLVGIGGLTRHSKKQVRSKVPILGDIPVLGWLFSTTSYKDEKSNLLIFVQVEVITPAGARYSDAGRAEATSTVTAREQPAPAGASRPPVVQPAQAAP